MKVTPVVHRKTELFGQEPPDGVCDARRFGGVAQEDVLVALDLLRPLGETRFKFAALQPTFVHRLRHIEKGMDDAERLARQPASFAAQAAVFSPQQP